MKLICDKKILVNKIGIAQKAISAKTTFEALKCLVLDATDDTLTIVGYDMEIGIDAVLQAQVEVNGKIAVESRLFGNIIRKMPEDTICLELSENGSFLLISSGKSSFKINVSDISEYPEIPSIGEGQSFTINSKALKRMIDQTQFAVSQDNTKPILMGQLLEIDSHCVSIASIDGYRLSVSKHRYETGIKSLVKIIVPGKVMNDIASIIGSDDFDIDFNFDNNFISSTFKESKLTARLIKGEFIDYNKLIPNDYNTEVLVNCQKLQSAIDRASIVNIGEKNSLVKMSITDEFIQVTSHSDAGALSEELQMQKDGDSLAIAFNSRYLLEGLKEIKTPDVTLKFTSNVNPCTVHPTDDSEYLYLLLPVRIANK